MAQINPSSSTSSFPTTTNNHINSTSFAASTASATQPDAEAPLSIFGITRRHCREELYVSPVKWSGRHVELLHFSFHGPYAEPVTAAWTETTEAEYSEQRSGTRHLKDFFNFYYKPVMREQGIWQLITSDGCPLVIYEAPLTLSLGTFVVKNLRCMAFYLEDSIVGRKVHKLPVAALIDQGRITEQRKDYLGLSRCQEWRYWNHPMCRLYEKKWKQITPPNPMHDPFITAVLIGLAQKKRRYLQEIGSPEEARTGKLYCQVVHTYNSRGQCKVKGEESYCGWLYLYQADIPSTLLDMFEQPKVAPPKTPYIDIRITKVTYYPLSTLRARLLELLLPGNAAATAAAEAASPESAVWQALARKVATDATEGFEHATTTRETVAQNVAQDTVVATPAAPPASMTQAAMVQPIIDPTATVQVQQAVDKAAVDQAAVDQAAVDQPVMNYTAMNYTAMAQPAMSYTAMAQPAMSYTAMAQPVMNYAPTAQPVTNYAPMAQPVTNYTAVAQPVMNYAPTAQPVMNYTAMAQPVTNYAPMVQPVTSYAPMVQPVTSYAPMAQPITSYAPMAQPVTNYAPMAQPAMNYAATEAAYVNQNAGQKRKFEDGHGDQPSQRWIPPSVYITQRY